MALNKRKVLLTFIGSFCITPKSRFKHYVPPLGISHLSSYIKQFDYQTRLIDLRLLSDFQEYYKIITKFKPEVIGLSVLTSEMDMALKTISHISDNFPKVKIIIGGPHATVLPDLTAKIAGVQAVVIGEGEYTFLELLNKIYSHKPLSNVKGIAYFDKNKVVITNPRQPIENLDKLPFPDRAIYKSTGWNTASYQLFFPMLYPISNIIVSRGCPGMCTMCQPTLDKIFGRPSRFRSPENVIREIKILISKYKIKSLIFWDDTLTANRPWLLKFCNLIKSNEIQINWWCYSRVNNLTQDTILMMKQAGCKMICFGIESGSQRILNDVMRKGTTVKQNIAAVNLCHQNGILSNANVMIGSPTETIQDVMLTDKLLLACKPDIVWASVTSPLPGTYLGDDAKKRGLLVNSKWSEYTRGQIGKPKLKLSLSNKDIIKYQTKWHCTRFRPNYILKPYYFLACVSLVKNHLTYFHPERILLDFIAGPIIESGRRLYWRYFFDITSTVPLSLNKKPKTIDRGTKII